MLKFRVDLSTSSAPGPRDLPSSYGRITRTTFDQQSFYPTCHFEIHHYSVACYAFLDQAGLILHATPKSARLKSAADTLFKSFQTTLDPLSLKRNRFKHNNRRPFTLFLTPPPALMNLYLFI
ncbi:hypothetical protein VP01_1082g1 [Puccinia sorghi]|uniref:Uncharacterized protein n=1 Tax=Puccinia sorghi TaxID=27349 RepID=A0A0L6VUN7_9BASI|nr:hypothetical protein VP01_1082g1 [Puccinia sorghi]